MPAFGLASAAFGLSDRNEMATAESDSADAAPSPGSKREKSVLRVLGKVA